jgi:hypothetical protein
MKISKDKTYKTRLGLDVIIYKIWEEQNVIHGVAIDAYGNPVCPLEWDLNGRVYTTSEVNNDLIEISPYEDFKIDDKVLVWDDENDKVKAYFAGVNKDGHPMTWDGRRTSFTESYKVVWTNNNCIKYEENNDQTKERKAIRHCYR